MTGSWCPDGVLQSCSGAGPIGLVFAIAGTLAGLMMLRGVARNRPVPATPWRRLAAGLLVMGMTRLLSVGLTVLGAPSGWALLATATGIVVGLGIATVGCLSFFSGRRVDGMETIDAAVVAAATGLVLWQLATAPLASAGGAHLIGAFHPARIVSGIALLAFLGLYRMAFGAVGRLPTGRLFIIGGFLGLGGTILGTVEEPSAVVVLVVVGTWLASLTSVAAAALHPSMIRFGEDHDPRRQRVGRTRLSLVASALAIGPTIQLVDLAPDTPVDLTVESALVLFVVIGGGLRVVQLLRGREQADGHVQRQLDLQRAVADLSRRALTSSDAQAMIDDATATAIELLGADAAAILELAPGDSHLRFRSGLGFEARTLAKGCIGRSGTLSGLILDSREPVVITDVASDPRIGDSMLGATGQHSAVGAAIREGQSDFGVLTVHSRARRTFGPHERMFVEAIANVVAGAIARDRSHARLRHQARHDGLTGLPNRLLLLERLEAACLQSRGDGPSVLAVEIDGLDVVNDTLGHEVGDRLTMAIAERLGTCFSVDDTLARYADDAFFGVWTGPTAAVEDVVAIVHAALSRPFQVTEGEVYVRASIGTSRLWRGDDTAQDLLRRANLALLWAKREGRTEAAFQPEMEAAAQQRLRLETDLRHAIERGEFVCHYQPQVEAASGRVVGLEALVRWDHPRLGVLAPGAFIEVAEQTGLVAHIDRWVLYSACRQAQEWLADGLEVGRVGVNISAATLQHVDLVEHLTAVLDDTGLDASRVELEVTESSVMHRPEAAISTLRSLRRLGVRVAVDDFGTGYSSLSYLQQFAVDTLKIDRSFVRSLSEASAARPVETGILKAIVALGQHLGLELVAEGVETTDQRDVLGNLGCDVVQGYLYSRPVPAEALVGMLRQGSVEVGLRPAS